MSDDAKDLNNQPETNKKSSNFFADNWLYLAIAAVLLAGVSFIFSGDTGKVTTVNLDKYQIALETNLPDLDTGYYEAWVQIPGESAPLSAGKFRESGLVTLGTSRALNEVSGVLVSIESESDTNSIPSGITILTGTVTDEQASLSVPIDFSESVGEFIISSPSDGPDTNEGSGLWFVRIQNEELVPGLNLPDMRGGFKYALWLDHDSLIVPLGRFKTVVGTDSFNGHKGTGTIPQFPGEDLLVNPPSGLAFPLDLTVGSSSVFITLEAELGGLGVIGPGPSTFKIFEAAIAASTSPEAPVVMTKLTDSLPTGSVDFR